MLVENKTEPNLTAFSLFTMDLCVSATVLMCKIHVFEHNYLKICKSCPYNTRTPFYIPKETDNYLDWKIVSIEQKQVKCR